MRMLDLLPIPVMALGLSLRAWGIAYQDTAHAWPPTPEGFRQWMRENDFSSMADLSNEEIERFDRMSADPYWEDKLSAEDKAWVDRRKKAWDAEMADPVKKARYEKAEEESALRAEYEWMKGLYGYTDEQMKALNLRGSPPDPSKPALGPEEIRRRQEQAQAEQRRCQVGSYEEWWSLNRDEVLLALPGERPDERYEPKALPPDALKPLLGLIGYEGDFSSLVKELALRRLRRIPKAGDFLLSTLKDAKAPAPERAWAAYALGELKTRRAIPDLTQALQEKDLDLRGFAALALGRMGDPEATQAILPLAVSKRENRDLRCMALLSLASTDLPKARETLRLAAATKTDDLSARRAALMALGVKPGREDREFLTRFCGDRDPAIRSAALMGLGLAGQSDELLRNALLRDKDGTARSYAALALGISRPAAALPDLVACLEKDKDWVAKACAALALGRLQTSKAVPALARALEDKNAYFVSDYAAMGLGLSKQEKALDPLAKGLKGRRNDLINACSTGLALLADPRSKEPLLKAQEAPLYKDVRQYATLALARLHLPETYDRFLSDLDEKTVGSGDTVAAAMALAIYGDPKACPALEKKLTVKHEFTRNTVALALDLLTEDPAKPLTLGDQFKGDSRNRMRRRVGPLEVQRLLNSYFPADYKLPIMP